MYKFECRFTESEEDFFANAKKLAENGGSYYIEDDPKDFGHISVTTNDLNGLVGFINYWYNQDNSFGITTEKDPIKRFGIEVL